MKQVRMARLLGAGALIALLLIVGTLTTWAQEGGSGDVTRGSQIFDANCAVCHGPDGKGRVGANLSNAFSAIDPVAFARSVVEQGVSGTPMIPWSKKYGGPLDDQQLEDVIAFVTSLSGGRSSMAPTATPFPVTPVPPVPGATGDPTHGKLLFLQNCSVCHGDQGQGRIGAALTKGFSSFNPQQFARTTIAQGVANSPMPAWGQAYGGPLTESEIDDISSYLITLPAQAVTPSMVTVQTPVRNTNWLVVLLVIVAAIILAVMVMLFSGRNTPA